MSTERYAEIRDNEGEWKDWDQPATKGDLIQVAVRARLLSLRVAGLVLTASSADREEQFQEYLQASDALMKVIDEIGSWKGQNG